MQLKSNVESLGAPSFDMMGDMDLKKTASCSEKSVIDRIDFRKVGFHSPLHDIALSLVIQAARDIVKSRKRKQDGISQFSSANANAAIRWFESTTEGILSFEACCYTLFTEDVCPKAVSAAILRNPSTVAALDMPPTPVEYMNLVSQQERLIKQNKIQKQKAASFRLDKVSVI
jgi:hypothetical protein